MRGRGGGSGEKPPEIEWEASEVVKKSVPRSPAGEVSGKTTAIRRENPKKDQHELNLDVVDRAAATKKPVMLFFAKAGNKDSLTMEKLVFGQNGIVEFAKNFHAVKVDSDAVDGAILKRYRVRSAPTVVFLDYQGNIVSLLAGKVTPKKLQAAMAAVVAKNKKLPPEKGPVVARAEPEEEKEEK